MSCSVEMTHLYHNQPFCEQQQACLRQAQSILPHLEQYQTVVLIDDYHQSEQPSLPLPSALDCIDYIGSERELSSLAETAINLSQDKRLRRSLLRWSESRQKWPCSVLTAVWYGQRLGVFNAPSAPREQSVLHAERLMNFLPAAHASSEAQALRLIKSWPNGSQLSARISIFLVEAEQEKMCGAPAIISK